MKRDHTFVMVTWVGLHIIWLFVCSYVCLCSYNMCLFSSQHTLECKLFWSNILWNDFKSYKYSYTMANVTNWSYLQHTYKNKQIFFETKQKHETGNKPKLFFFCFCEQHSYLPFFSSFMWVESHTEIQIILMDFTRTL